MILEIILYFICFNNICGNNINEENISAKTTSGVVKGNTIQVLNQSIEQYLGIPYAEPPIGSLRFAKPKPIHLKNETIEAKQTNNSCIQYKRTSLAHSNISEDCLLLNIWTPKIRNELKPVMFWIYGGALSYGSIFMPIYSGEVLATHEVVVVSANYRTGALGFLYGGQESAPGNVGFYDQLLALNWVKENIHLFGGDKNKITIFGGSAGSWSVSAHLISPLSKGLFKRAIMQSGALRFNKERYLNSKEEALIGAKQLAKSMNCSVDKQWLECLRKVDSHHFIPKRWDLTFPTFGTEFLPFSSQKAFNELKFNKDILAGVTKDEGSILVPFIIPEWHKKKSFVEKDFYYFVNQTNHVLNHNINLKNITDFYLNNVNKSDSKAIKWKIYDFLGHIMIGCPTYLFAKRYSELSINESQVFFYEMTYKITDFGLSLRKGNDLGIFHTAELDFVFGLSLLNPKNISKENIDFSKQVMKYWTDFAKYGQMDNNWIKFIDTKTNSSFIKDLNPKNTNYFNTLYDGVCDTLLINYF